MKTTTRQLLSTEEVMQRVYEQTPHLTEHMYEDRAWIWYCGPSLQGEHNKATREALKEIGFRFSPGGHLMPDNETRGTWGHSCDRPMFNRRKPKAKEEDAVSTLEALGL